MSRFSTPTVPPAVPTKLISTAWSDPRDESKAGIEIVPLFRSVTVSELTIDDDMSFLLRGVVVVPPPDYHRGLAGRRCVRNGHTLFHSLATVRWTAVGTACRASPVRPQSGRQEQPSGVSTMAFSMYDASVPLCAQQLGALAGIAGKAADHCASSKIEEAALLQDRLFPDMFCLARQLRQAADFGANTPGRLAGVAAPAFAAVDDTTFAAAKKRLEDSLAFVNSLKREQIDGSE